MAPPSAALQVLKSRMRSTDPALPAYLQRPAAAAWFEKAAAALEQGQAIAQAGIFTGSGAVGAPAPDAASRLDPLPPALNGSEHQPQPPQRSEKKEPNQYLGKRPPVLFPARCSGNGRRSTIRDIQRALAMFSLQEGQIRIQYNEHFLPAAFWIDFHTQEDQLRAQETSPHYMGPRKIWIYAETMQMWKQGIYHPFAHDSRGRFVLVTGIQENATLADIARHFQTYSVMPNGITFLRAPTKPRLDAEPREGQDLRARHKALVRMRSMEEAARAIRDLTNSFLLNNVVRLRMVP